MAARLLYLNSAARISDICSVWGCDSDKLQTGQHLFEIKNVSDDLKDTLITLAQQFIPDFEIIQQTETELLLKVVPRRNTFDNLPAGNALFKDFTGRLKSYFQGSPVHTWQLKNGSLTLGNVPRIMGILNVTPDSFSDGGRFMEKDRAVEQALKMIEEGADIIDVGGESTRPGAAAVSQKEEINRVIPVIEEIRRHTQVLISVDTYKSAVADLALSAGADIINDISGTTFDEQMEQVVEKHNCPLILMHTKGSPQTMQNNPLYGDVVEEVYNFLDEKCARIARLNAGKVIIDPGIGFGKTHKDNVSLLRCLTDFTFINKALMVGVSRKSFIGAVSGADVEQRLTGSLAAAFHAFSNGANLIRVHDIKETCEVRRMWQALQGA